MTRINTIGINPNEALRETERRREQQQARPAPEEPVVSSVKPELTEAGDALKVAVSFFANATRSPAQAVSAQTGLLDEERVKALLSEE